LINISILIGIYFDEFFLKILVIPDNSPENTEYDFKTMNREFLP